MYLCLLFVCFSIATSLEQFYKDSKYVKEITTIEEFREIHSIEHNLVIEFYAHWCGHCQKFSSDYEKAAEHLNNIMVFAAVNCDHNDKSNEVGPVCGHFKIQNLPTVIMLKPREIEEIKMENGQKGMVKKQFKYEGKRTAAALSKWALKNLEDGIIKTLSTEEELNQFLTFGPQDLSKIIVFGEKASPSNYLKFIAQTVRPDYPDFQKVSFVAYTSKKEFAESLGIKDFPAIAVLKGNNKKVENLFNGEMTFDNMKNWIQENSGEPTKETQSQAKPKPKPTPKRELELYEVESEEDWEKACPNSPRGLCLLTFLYPSDEAHDSYVGILNKIYPNHSQLHVSMINREKFPIFSNSFNIGEMNPQVVMFQRGTLRVKNFFGGFEPEQLEEFILNALSGKRIFVLDDQPKFDVVKAEL